jgi:hypothetical protein
MSKDTTKTIPMLILGVLMCVGTAARAAELRIAGSPGYDPATSTGLKEGEMPCAPGSAVNNSGTTIGNATKYVSGTTIGSRAVRWDASGGDAIELGNLGTYSTGYTNISAYAVNSEGTAVGCAFKSVGGIYKGGRAVRWDASGTATELGNLGTDNNGLTDACAYAVNGGGRAAGWATKYVSGSNQGERAVRWDASGTVATELGNLGTNGNFTGARAYAINNAGTAVGFGLKYAGATFLGYRATRWGASGTAVWELGNLGTDAIGFTSGAAFAINAAGTVVGYSKKYVGGNDVGSRAVRWGGSGTVATELGNLGVSTNGSTDGRAYAVNAAGTAVGYQEKYLGGSDVGSRAVRWDASGTVATELGDLGTNASGTTNAEAYAVNDVGTAVGQSAKYANGSSVGNRAVIWLPDASVIDLNDLGVVPVPAGGSWTLGSAKALSADGWVAGEGIFDPDGAGPLAAYARLWVAQVGLGGTWTKAAGGTWGRGPNWSTGTPAMQVGNAVFNLNSAYTVALDRDELTKTVALGAGAVTLDLAGHALTTESGLSIAPAAALNAAGRLVSDVTNAGTLSPGNGTGTLVIDGSLISTATLEFEIGGLSSHDAIKVTEGFNAGGSIVVKLLGGYAPAYGDRFDLMSFGSLNDNGYAFDFTGAELSAGLQWDTTSFATTGCVTVVPEPATLFTSIIGIAGGMIFACRKRR